MDNYYKSVGDMLGDRVVVTEKLDGANFSVHIEWNRISLDWDVSFRSRNQAVNERADGLFFQAIQIAQTLIPKMITAIKDSNPHGVGAVFYFEVIGRGVQNRVDYSAYTKEDAPWPVIDGRTIALIDVCWLFKKMDGIIRNDWCVWKVIERIGGYFKVAMPMAVTYSKLTLAIIEELLEHHSCEGYVIRAEDEYQVLYTHYGDLKRVKLKTNWFNSFEKKGKVRKAKPKTPPEIIEFLMERINFGRLHSVYSHGNDDLVYEMKDMKYLIDLVVEDIKGEDDSLWAEFDAEVIKKTCARMLPKVLQGYLLERNTPDE
jgi:hypothetical protein